MDKISVITPFYNGNKYLEKLKEILQNNVLQLQKVAKVDVEIILVNDSPWIEIETEKIYSDLFEVVIINQEKNCGIHSARVKGLNKATGKYITFWDQDDVWHEMFLKEMYVAIAAGKYDCAIANGIFETSGGDKLILNSYGRVHYSQKYYAYLIIGNLLSSPGQCLILKEAIPEYWKVNIMKSNCADDLFLWCLLFKKTKIIYCNRLLYTHANTGENCSLDKKKGYESDLEVYEYLKQSGMIPKCWLRIFKMRYDYNIQKLSENIYSPVSYGIYFFILLLFKIQMKVVTLFYRFKGNIVKTTFEA